MMGHIETWMDFKQRAAANLAYFNEHIAYLMPGWIKLDEISGEASSKARELELGLHKEKPKELVHQRDYFGRARRFKMGPRVEAAVKDTYCVLSSFDTTVGDSRKYSHADFMRLKVGIKTAQFGCCPMVYKEPYYPEIITSYTDDGDIYICGLATVHMLKTYVSTDLLNDTNPSDRKTGFYGHEHLIPLHNYLNIESLDKLLKELGEGKYYKKYMRA